MLQIVILIEIQGRKSGWIAMSALKPLTLVDGPQLGRNHANTNTISQRAHTLHRYIEHAGPQ